MKDESEDMPSLGTKMMVTTYLRIFTKTQGIIIPLPHSERQKQQTVCQVTLFLRTAIKCKSNNGLYVHERENGMAGTPAKRKGKKTLSSAAMSPSLISLWELFRGGVQ